MRAVLGRMIEITGWLACLLGLVAAFWLVVTEGPIATWILDLWRALTGVQDLRLPAILTGMVCVLPGLALIAAGSGIAGSAALTPRWAAALMAPRTLTSGRRLAVLLCLLIAGLAIAAFASLWAELRLATQ